METSSSILLKAPAYEVWWILTTEKSIEYWYYCNFVKLKLQIGGEYIFQTLFENGAYKYEDKGVIQKLVTHKEITFQFYLDAKWKENVFNDYLIWSFILSEENEGKYTKLTFVQENIHTSEQMEWCEKRSNSVLAIITGMFKFNE